ncbi:class I SAM-dependent methyltransferase [Micromonospora sp. WMMA1363]|uniref:class I SAM-dependent methyltransferase n=1 Tax=Micromonospora sp. WMMA1363 TaxID=3053985 RepID=UPI00259CA9F4|nr:class I SAM-dependent methyltransferase [Micromonospora sp. WMMA1363]MDM4719682.1 class I SAM-dependent methyltransferase [Micromonospora sp. WMMA1363]
MTHDFDDQYWQRHWHQVRGGQPRWLLSPNPYVVDAAGGRTPGRAMDAGCGEGTEAIWLAQQGWEVTAVDIASTVLRRAAARATEHGVPDVRWVGADLTVWKPDDLFELVTSHYAHPSGSQLAFYERLARWVAPGGTLLIVGHPHHHGAGQPRGHQPPAEASVTAADITAHLDGTVWAVDTAAEIARAMTGRTGQQVLLNDVVVRATRR